MTIIPSDATDPKPLHRADGALRIGNSISLINLCLAVIGAALSVLAYQSFFPSLAALLFFMLARLVLAVTPLGGEWERRMFTRVFGVGWVMLGLAGVYAEFFGDPVQLFGDASQFYRLAAGATAGLKLDAIRHMTEGALAVVMWRELYDVFALIGFPKGRYIGVLVNVTAVALSGVLAIKIARYEYGNDTQRLNRLILLVSSCGLLWLFAGIHLRDGAVFFSVTLLIWIWAWFLSNPGFGPRFWILAGGSVVFSSLLVFLRTEFYFIPFAVAAAGVVALLFSTEDKQRRSRVGLVMAGVGLVAVVVMATVVGRGLIETVIAARTSYAEHAAGEQSAGSLGMSLVVNQPLPIRLVLGTIYLYVFPIPFWVGFQLESAYNLFRSFNALFFYGLNPLLVLSVGTLVRNKSLRTANALFLLFCTIGFSVAVAITSLELRHFGAFLVPVLVTALIPDLKNVSVRRNYQRLLAIFLSAVLLVHLAWLAVKYLR